MNSERTRRTSTDPVYGWPNSSETIGRGHTISGASSADWKTNTHRRLVWNAATFGSSPVPRAWRGATAFATAWPM